MPFTAPADVLSEFEKRRKNNPDFNAAFKIDATNILLDAIADRLGLGGNVYIFCFGRNNSGKSISVQTIALLLIAFFRILGYDLDPWLDIKLTRNYSQSNEAFSERMLGPRKDIPVLVIQDENESMSGRDRQYATRNLFNNLRTMRGTRYCYFLCTVDHYKQILSIREKMVGLGFIILETIDQDRRARFEGTNRLMFHSLEGEHGLCYLDHHGDEKFVLWYENEKEKAQERLTSSGGASSAKSNLMALAEDIYDETLLEIKEEPLKSQDFKSIAAKMQGEGKLSGTTDTVNDAAWLAYRVLYPARGKAVTPKIELPEPQTIVADSPDPEPEKLPEEDNQALREIVYQELCKAFPKSDASVLEEFREYYYPSTAQEQEQHWTFRNVREVLGRSIRTESIGKNVRAYYRDFSNHAKEQIGLRFIEWKLQHSSFPPQTSFETNSGPGMRDLAFYADADPGSGRRLIASANVKHFLDNRDRGNQIHMAPEYQDAVHYMIVLTTRPLRIHVQRGDGGEYQGMTKEGSVGDLDWAGFVEDLRKEAEKAGNSEQASSPA